LKKTTILIAALGLLVLALSVFAGNDGTNKSTDGQTGRLPNSLGNFYPPNSNGPVYLFAMLDLAPNFSGIRSDLMEGEPENVKMNYDIFRNKYLASAEMIPEWKADFNLAAVENLGSAIESGKQEKIIEAFEEVGKACVDCHVMNATAVRDKYYWGDFASVTATDPVSGQDVSFMQYMFMIESDFSGIGVDLAEGQTDKAIQHLDNFERRYGSLKSTCDGCHDSERHYYVDSNITGMVSGLKTALRAETVDGKVVGSLLQGIGVESCYKCHVVHTPSAYARAMATSR